MEHKIKLLRTYFPEGTNSILLFDDVEHSHAIELPWKENETGHSCIPEGKYLLIKRYSQKHGHHLQVLNVPGRDLILIHPANNAVKELRGCIAPVTTITGPGLGATSKIPTLALNEKVFTYLNRGEKVYIEITKAA